LKYSLHPKELSGWKARITERLIQCYIEDVLISVLRKQGWDDAIYDCVTWLAPKFPWMREAKLEYQFFIANGLFPTPEFLKKFEKLTDLLENAPDGFLIKLKKTGKFRRLKEAFNALSSWRVEGLERGIEEQKCRLRANKDEQLPIVNGEIEVIEVKSGKSNLPPHQKRSYRNIIQEGYGFRFFHVNIISFDRNEFEIREKLLTNPSELKSFPLKNVKSLNVDNVL